MATKQHDRGAGAFSRSHPVITKDKTINSAGNPVRPKPREVPPDDRNGGMAASVGGGAVVRPVYKSAVRRHFGR
jgi:hypothetical protein